MARIIYEILYILLLSSFINADIQGTPMLCSEEGMPIKLDKSFACYSCMCRNRFIECQPKSCPKIDDCMNPIVKHDDPCCKPQCKGCWLNNTLIESGVSKVSPDDPCTRITCVNGVLTEAEVSCFSPCAKPIPPKPGQCCPRCQVCTFRGQNMTRGSELRLTEDPCVTCTCDMDGFMFCSKIACPVVNCGLRQRIKVAGKCCPQCAGAPSSRTLLNPPRGTCLLGRSILRGNKDNVPIDSCSRCKCIPGYKESNAYCVANTCPPLLDCPYEQHFQANPNDCCKTCPTSETLTLSNVNCHIKGEVYKEGESWKVTPCMSCQCESGVVKCATADCGMTLPGSRRRVLKECPHNHKLVTRPGQCCPECIENEGLCMLFGMHIRTFDEKFLHFQSLSGKYQLASDCSKNRAFQLRMSTVPANKRNSLSVRPKVINLTFGGNKVSLGQKLKARVNGHRVIIPYTSDKINLTLIQNNLHLSTSIGILMKWNGESLAEIYVPTEYRSKLCGLCGNYNGDPEDDAKNRKGRLIYKMSFFAEAWKVGEVKNNSLVVKSRLKRRENCPMKEKERHLRDCILIMADKYEGFCNEAIHSRIYYDACLEEMCTCTPRERCICQVLDAYFRDCIATGNHSDYRMDRLKTHRITELQTCYESFPDILRKTMKGLPGLRPQVIRPQSIHPMRQPSWKTNRPELLDFQNRMQIVDGKPKLKPKHILN